MRRMQRQSIRKKGPMREGKSIRVASVNSPLAGSPMGLSGRAGPAMASPPSTFQKLYTHSPSSGMARVRASLSIKLDPELTFLKMPLRIWPNLETQRGCLHRVETTQVCIPSKGTPAACTQTFPAAATRWCRRAIIPAECSTTSLRWLANTATFEQRVMRRRPVRRQARCHPT